MVRPCGLLAASAQSPSCRWSADVGADSRWQTGDSCGRQAAWARNRPKARRLRVDPGGEVGERLMLVDPHGQIKIITSPRASVFLPPGRYVLQQVDFEGGFPLYPNEVLLLTPQTPTKLNVGNSLKPSVTATRKGKLLQLDYQLLDAGGRNCANAIAPIRRISTSIWATRRSARASSSMAEAASARTRGEYPSASATDNCGSWRRRTSVRLGPHQGVPVLFQWSWHYSLPDAAALGDTRPAAIRAEGQSPSSGVARSSCRLGLVMLVWRMPLRLFPISDGQAQTVGFFVESGVLAWSIVWLLGHWLATRYRNVSFLLIYGVLLAVGLLSYYCQYEDYDELAPLMIGFGICCIPLPLAMMLSSFFSRGIYSQPRFGLWLAIVDRPCQPDDDVRPLCRDDDIDLGHMPELLFLLFLMAIYSLSLTCILYLINLPFLMLAFTSPFYTEPLREALLHRERLFDRWPEDRRDRTISRSPTSRRPSRSPKRSPRPLGVLSGPACPDGADHISGGRDVFTNDAPQPGRNPRMSGRDVAARRRLRASRRLRRGIASRQRAAHLVDDRYPKRLRPLRRRRCRLAVFLPDQTQYNGILTEPVKSGTRLVGKLRCRKRAASPFSSLSCCRSEGGLPRCGNGRGSCFRFTDRRGTAAADGLDLLGIRFILIAVSDRRLPAKPLPSSMKRYAALGLCSRLSCDRRFAMTNEQVVSSSLSRKQGLA